MLRTLCICSLVSGSLLAGCGGGGGGIGPGCDELGNGPAATRVEAALDATDQLAADVTDLTGELDSICRTMAADIALTIPDPAGQPSVEVSCGTLADEIEAIVQEALPAGETLVLTVEPAACSIDVDAAARCAGSCDANIGARAEVTCTEGQLSGRCTGSCGGECRIEGTAVCASECRGSCTGTCDGNCTGACSGTCSATDSEGNCIGTCDGDCTGSCSGECIGTCSGTCVSDVTGVCEGTCSGTCDVELEAPRCEGEAMIMAEASCQATCESELRADAECTEPQVTVSTSTPVDYAAQPRLADLVGMLQLRWPRFVAIQKKLQGVVTAGQGLGTTITDLQGVVGEVGAQAGACLTVAARTAGNAVTTLTGSVSVSLEVSASVNLGREG